LPVVGLLGVALVVTASAASNAGPKTLADCRSAPAFASAVPAQPASLRGEAWFRVDPILDERSTLAGQRLVAGLHAGRRLTVDLAPEAFAAGPVGDVVLFGTDDGVRSETFALDVRRGCVVSLAVEQDVVRSATLAPGGDSVFEHRVDRATRRDLGVFRRPLDGGGAVRVVEPLEADPRFGPTFTTELVWSADGARLAIQSCGAVLCRTRVLHLETGVIARLGGEGHGPVIGLAGDKVVTYVACPGLPCPVVATSLTTGSTATLADVSGLAVLAFSDGPRLVHETAGDPTTVRVVAFDGTVERTIALPRGRRLMATGARSSSGARSPHGFVLATADGRAGNPAAFVVGLDGAAVEISEVLR
jgi:hypothetical protein